MISKLSKPLESQTLQIKYFSGVKHTTTPHTRNDLTYWALSLWRTVVAWPIQKIVSENNIKEDRNSSWKWW